MVSLQLTAALNASSQSVIALQSAAQRRFKSLGSKQSRSVGMLGWSVNGVEILHSWGWFEFNYAFCCICCPETTPPLSQLSFVFWGVFSLCLSHFLNCKCYHFYSYSRVQVWSLYLFIMVRKKVRRFFLLIFCLQLLVLIPNQPALSAGI